MSTRDDADTRDDEATREWVDPHHAIIADGITYAVVPCTPECDHGDARSRPPADTDTGRGQ